MNASQIPVIVVSYNSVQLVEKLVVSFRKFYPNNKIHIIEGSDDGLTPDAIQQALPAWGDVQLHAFGFNIHHGPGMAWAIENLSYSGPVLFLDSDIEVIAPGFIEDLLAQLDPNLYGVGFVGYVNDLGFDIDYVYGAIAYLHPPCMLCNMHVMREWPLPIKHGAPMFSAMKALHEAGKSDLLKNIPWVFNDTEGEHVRIFLDHAGRGTVKATGSYNLDEWMADVQTQLAQRNQAKAKAPIYNHDLLNLMPVTSNSIIEFGCSSGELAAVFKEKNQSCNYLGIEMDKTAIALARNHCDAVEDIDIDNISDAKLQEWSDRDCWVFGDVLEHLKDPAKLLSRIRAVISDNACVVVCIPNMQHWSIVKQLATGDIFYTLTGLLDKTHLRWFTRKTILDMFNSAGFQMEVGFPRIIPNDGGESYLPLIGEIAKVSGQDPEMAMRDALAIQYVIRFIPTR